jgi:tetratricopeptide (TPR) repeat protein
LEDWLLPVVFGQRPVPLKFRNMTRKEQARFYVRGAQVGDEPATEYGFVGRDLDIQTIERRLLTAPDSNELLVQGMAGAGKSALLAHLAWWWQRTGLVDQVFRFSYEDRAWTRDLIVRGIRPTLFGSAEHAKADAMPEDAQAEQVAERLRSQRHLLILDNAESITAAPAAIPHKLAPDERWKLKSLLSRLRGGRTLVLLGSRGSESWLTSGHAGLGIYQLRGLDPQAASVLGDRILARHGATFYLTDGTERPALEELVALLGGYPLPLTVVLPVLASAAPSQVLAELRAGGAGADPEGLVRTAIEYSHGKLDPVLQNSLLLLAPFTSVIGTGPVLQRYQELLLADESVQNLGLVDLAAALDQAVSVGLAAPHLELTNTVGVQPALPYFLRSRLHGSPALQAASTQAHYELYREISVTLADMIQMEKDPQERATGHVLTQSHYANLTAALYHAQDSRQPIWEVIQPLALHLMEIRQYAPLRKLADDAIARHPAPAAPARQRELAYLHSLAGQAALEQHELDAAKVYYETELTMLRAGGNPESEYLTYHQLGRVAQGHGRYADAEAHYRQALDLEQEFSKRAGSARTYSSLGTVVFEQHRYAEAEALYHQALALYQEFGNWYESADVLANLGRLAQARGHYEQAAPFYGSAIGIYRRYGDSSSAAHTRVAFGTVLKKQGRYADAEALYRQALDVFLEVGDQYAVADVHFQLASATGELGRHEQSEAHSRKAIDIYLEFGDRHSAAKAYAQLGVAAQAQGRYADATASLHRAIGMFLEVGDSQNAALAYHYLGVAEQGQSRYEEAVASYREALEIRRESDTEASCITALELGRLLVRLGRHREAVEALLYAAATWHQLSGQWYDQALQWLHRERELMEPAEFAALVAEIVPASLAGKFIAATDAAGDPGDDGANGATEPTGSSGA